MSESQEALMLAERLLDEPYADPDDDLRMLSRQLIRKCEALQYVLTTLEQADTIPPIVIRDLRNEIQAALQ